MKVVNTWNCYKYLNETQPQNQHIQKLGTKRSKRGQFLQKKKTYGR